MSSQKDFWGSSDARGNSAGPGLVDAIYRYPVKGMTPERLPQVSLRPHQTLPNDRAYAIENGTRDFDDATPRYFPKIKYLMLMKNEKLATLHSHFDDASHTLTISRDGQEMVKGTLTSAAGRGAIEEFLTTYMERDLRGPPRIVHAEGFSFSDVARKVVSILNLASLRALEEALGRPLDPLRFRANIHLEGLQPWEEFDWVGREFSLGEAGLKGVSRIVRCAAVNVDPKTAARDTEIPAFLFKTYGHADFGIYADVRTGGVVREQNQFS